jgi:hypothetical protein
VGQEPDSSRTLDARIDELRLFYYTRSLSLIKCPQHVKEGKNTKKKKKEKKKKKKKKKKRRMKKKKKKGI